MNRILTDLHRFIFENYFLVNPVLKSSYELDGDS